MNRRQVEDRGRYGCRAQFTIALCAPALDNDAHFCSANSLQAAVAPSLGFGEPVAPGDLALGSTQREEDIADADRSDDDPHLRSIETVTPAIISMPAMARSDTSRISSSRMPIGASVTSLSIRRTGGLGKRSLSRRALRSFSAFACRAAARCCASVKAAAVGIIVGMFIQPQRSKLLKSVSYDICLADSVSAKVPFASRRKTHATSCSCLRYCQSRCSRKCKTSLLNCCGSCRKEKWLTSGWIRRPAPGIWAAKNCVFSRLIASS